MMKKRTVNDYLSLDIRKIKAIFDPKTAYTISYWTVNVPFREPITFSSKIMLRGDAIYIQNPFNVDEEIDVPILLRRVHFGLRKGFQCPACSRRCEILYFGSEEYGCRECLELTYPSVQEAHKMDRFLRELLPDIPLRLAKKIYRELMNI